MATSVLPLKWLLGVNGWQWLMVSSVVLEGMEHLYMNKTVYSLLLITTNLMP